MPPDHLSGTGEDLARCPCARKGQRKPGCENGDLGKTALAVLRSLLFDFTNMKTGVCFPRVRTLQERLRPWYSRAAIFRALDRLEASGIASSASIGACGERGRWCKARPFTCSPRFSEAEQTMVQKAKALAKATARAVRPVLWLRKSSESHSALVPSENLIVLSEKRRKTAPDVSAHDRAGIGLQMRELLASLKRRETPICAAAV